MAAAAQMQKLVSSVEVKLDANVIHEVLRDRPNDLSRTTPKFINSVDLRDGQWGKVGCAQRWNFTLDGNKKYSDERVEAIDDANKSIRWKVLEGDIKAVYPSFGFILNVEKAGENKALVTWTLEYEKKNESTPDPHGIMEICLTMTKDMEA